MAKTSIASNAKEFTAKLDKRRLEIHMEIMRGLAANMDDVRYRAVRKYMINADRQPTYEFRRKLYPVSDPSRLLIRSGKLADVLETKGEWKFGKNISRLYGNKHLMLWIRPQLQAGNRKYITRISIVKKGDAGIGQRIKHETGRGLIWGPKRRMTWEQKWQLRMSRGQARRYRARPFVEPALQDQKFKIEPKLWKFIHKPIQKAL